MGIRHKYEKVEGKLWEVLKQFEEGAEFYQYNPDINEVKPMFSRIESINILMANLIDLGVYRKVEPPWYESIPKGGVFCWVSEIQKEPDYNGFVNGDSDAAIVNRYVSTDVFPYEVIDIDGCYWKYATPLTRAEIQVFMDNAPEE